VCRSIEERHASRWKQGIVARERFTIDIMKPVDVKLYIYSHIETDMHKRVDQVLVPVPVPLVLVLVLQRWHRCRTS
jgi:hypothetical protein